MHATRALRFVGAESKQTGLLLPPRTFMDIFSSAANAVLNLFTSEQDRIRFAASVEQKWIDPSVLSQANFSYLRILALHDELGSPTLQKYGFNINEFMNGVKPALEQMHQVQAALLLKANEIASMPLDKEQDEEATKDDDSNYIMSPLFFSIASDSKQGQVVKRLLHKKYSWKDIAEKDEESNEARLVKMLSPHHLDNFEISTKLATGLQSTTYQDIRFQVHNIALLSARGMVIGSDDDDDEMSSKQHVVDQQEDASNNNDSKQPAVAVQVEVLYDVEETMEISIETKEQSKSDGDSDKVETETITRTNVVVGIFEGWLSGGDNSDLRWRVADIRFPVEFPFLHDTRIQ